MDKLIHPNHRRWISPLTHLGKSMKDVKKLVRLRKESLLVVDPAECQKPAQSQRDSKTSSRSGEEEPAAADGKDYMASSARNLGEDDLVIEAESERLKEELTRAEEIKWAKGDEICESAVAFVGGPDFFDLSDKKLKKDKKELARLMKGAGGGAAAFFGDVKDEGEGMEFEEEDDDDGGSFQGGRNSDPQQPCSSSSMFGNQRRSRDPQPGCSTSMYEDFNYGDITNGPEDEEGEQEGPSGNLVEDDPLKDLSAIRDILLPQGLRDEEEDDEALNTIDFHNDIFNFPSASQRYDTYRKVRPDLVHSDEEDEDEANKENSSDEEFSFEMPGTSAGAPPPPPAPATSIPAAKLKEAKRSTLTKVKKDQGQGQGDRNAPSTSMSMALAIPASNGNSAGGGGIFGDVPGDAEAEQKAAVSDFDNFTDWVFQQSQKKDREQRNKMKPDLMKKFKKDISYFQRTTSANLASVKGEVFQDDTIMESSSMPLLAPPILPPASTDLQSLAIFITHGEDPSCFPWKSINVQQQINDDFTNHEYLKRMEQQKKDLADPGKKEELVDKEEDFVVQVLVYQPTDPDEVLPDEVKLYSEPRLAYELRILGSQTVRHLMEAIHCENDFSYMKDVSHPDDFVEDPAEFAKAKFPSCLMLIHDTIFSSPDDAGMNFHKLINDWIQKPPQKKVGPFKSGNWDVKLSDLQLRFGFPYVYVHLGGCEHIVVFTKARLLNAEDNHLLKDYPKIHGMTRFKSVYCRVDNEYLARWAVLDSKEFPENPMLLCTECVMKYCFDSHKKRQGDFRLYPFTQIANLI